jgi:integrase
MREQGYAAWTIRGVLVAVSQLSSFAVRRGQLSANPVPRLERGERPRVVRREQRILSTDELAALLANALPGYRALLATAALTGLRLSELLGLVWSEVDFEKSFVRVRRQLDRGGQRAQLKSPAAVRDVVLVDSLAQLLHGLRDEARAARPVPLDRERDFVFATENGTPRGHRNVEQRGLDKAAERARLIPPKDKRKRTDAEAADPRTLRFHDLRHLFASMLIAQGADVVFVSRQLGHADPSITLRVYAHLFAAQAHANRTRALLEAAVGNVLETEGGERRRTRAVPDAGNVAQLHISGACGD